MKEKKKKKWGVKRCREEHGHGHATEEDRWGVCSSPCSFFFFLCAVIFVVLIKIPFGCLSVCVVFICPSCLLLKIETKGGRPVISRSLASIRSGHFLAHFVRHAHRWEPFILLLLLLLALGPHTVPSPCGFARPFDQYRSMTHKKPPDLLISRQKIPAF